MVALNALVELKSLGAISMEKRSRNALSIAACRKKSCSIIKIKSNNHTNNHTDNHA
jgi:hypothetical protein